MGRRKYLYLGHFMLSCSDEDFKKFWVNKYICIGGTRKEWKEMKNRAVELNVKR